MFVLVELDNIVFKVFFDFQVAFLFEGVEFFIVNFEGSEIALLVD